MTRATLPVPVAPATRPTVSGSLVAAFLAGRSPQTMRAYRQDLEDFSAYLGAPNLDAAAQRLLTARPGPANGLVLAYRFKPH